MLGDLKGQPQQEAYCAVITYTLEQSSCIICMQCEHCNDPLQLSHVSEKADYASW